MIIQEALPVSLTIAGCVMALTITEAFAADSYTATDIGTIAPFGINNQGNVVGAASFTWSTPAHACILNGTNLLDLGTVGSSTYSQGQAINDNNQVVGYFDISNGWNHAFLYSDGKMQDLGTLDANDIVGADSVAYAINVLGQVVGSSATSTGAVRAFLYSAGTMTDLGTLGGTNSGALGINSKGEIVGSADTATGESHVFLYSGGVMKDIGIKGGATGGINDSSQIAGTFQAADGSGHAYIYSAGQMTDLAMIGATNTFAYDINNKGQVVGAIRTNDGSGWHGFLYSDGQMFDLNQIVQAPAGWIMGRALGINDQGWIVCSGFKLFSLPHTFLLKPIVQSPRLTFAASQANLVLSWPDEGYILETTDSLDQNAVWTPLTNGVVTSGTASYFTNTAAKADAFFRLRK